MLVGHGSDIFVSTKKTIKSGEWRDDDDDDVHVDDVDGGGGGAVDPGNFPPSS